MNLIVIATGKPRKSVFLMIMGVIRIFSAIVLYVLLP